MHLVEIFRHPGSTQISELVAFVESVTAEEGVRPLSDHLWIDLRAGGTEGFVAVRLSDEAGVVALAQVSAANDSSSLEVVTAPGRRPTERLRAHDDAALTAIDAFRHQGGGRLSWWLDDPDEGVLDLAAGAGLTPVRALHEMRRTLPTAQRADIATRSFRPGEDDAAWVEVNNRAFASHGEQGGWSRETLALRRDEPWFDPDGFRIHERDGRIAAFCWTKLHHELDPVVGEIYVIAVDPNFQGQGLGRQLTLAGLDSITDRGVGIANLYVDADNTAAIDLYDRLGFAIHRTRRVCAGDLPPIEPTETP